MRLFTQSLAILLSCALVLLIISSPLSSYTAPILGLLIAFSVIGIIIKQRIKKGEELFRGSAIEVFTVILALLLAVFLTGGLGSNLYFLLYFLIFGIVFLFEPATVFVLLLGLLVVFYQSIFEGDMVSNLIKLGSLVFLSPISYFLGREFQRREKVNEQIKDKTGKIIENAETLKTHVQNDEEMSEIEDIEENAKKLKDEI